MTRPSDRLTDELLAAALARRAPHGPDASLLAGIIGEVATTSQRRSWATLPGATQLPSGARLALLAAVMVMALALLGVALAGAFRADPFEADVVPPPISTSRPTGEVTPSDQPRGHCTTNGAPPLGQVEIDAAAALDIDAGIELLPDIAPPAASIDAGRIAFIGPDPDADVRANGQGTVWAVEASGEPRTLARFTMELPARWIWALAFPVARTDGVDGLIVPLVWGTPDFSITCSDLYLLAWDGSSARRLTRQGDVDPYGGIAVSSDGTLISYQSSEGIRVVDLAGRDTLLVDTCALEPRRGANQAFSPTGDRLATVCPDKIVVTDLASGEATTYATGRRIRDPDDAADWEALVVAWAPTGDAIRYASNVPGLDNVGPFELDLGSGVVSRMWTAPDPWLPPFTTGFVGFTPDGRWFLYDDAVGSRGGTVLPALVAIDLEGGTAVELDQDHHPAHGWELPPPWTLDGSAYVSITHEEDGSHTFWRTALDGSGSRIIGHGPADYELFAFRIP
jgi:hypothetical protein